MKYIDMHCDTISEIWYSDLRGERYSLRKNPLMIDLEKMRKGDCLCQNFGLFIDLHRPADFRGEEGEEERNKRRKAEETGSFMDPWKTVLQLVRVFREETERNSDLVGQVTSAAEIEANEKAGKMSALLTIEEGGACKGDISHLQELYDAGARMMTLTWNYPNELGKPNVPPKGFEEDFSRYFRFEPETENGHPAEKNGLTKNGFAFAEAMQDMGMLVDVSHLSDAGFYDVAKTVKGPFVASHSNCRALAGCNRNLTDDMIRTVAEHGGVIGLNFCPSFVTEAPVESQCRCSLEALAEHARHMIKVGGSGVVGLGSDFDGIGREGLEMENCAQLPKLEEELRRQHFTESEIEGIFHANVLRVYRDVLRSR